MNTLKETNNNNNMIEFLKLGAGGLFEIIDGLAKAGNVLRMRKFLWRLYIDFILEIFV